MDVLGLANCPRLRVLRDLLFGEGAVAELVGVAGAGSKRRGGDELQNPKLQNDATKSARSDARRNEDDIYVVRALPLALFMLCPGVVLALRAHELWGLDCFEGAAVTAFGFALFGMWCQGLARAVPALVRVPDAQAPRRRRRACRRASRRHATDAWHRNACESVGMCVGGSSPRRRRRRPRARARRVGFQNPRVRNRKIRGVVPGAARAATLEALLLAARARARWRSRSARSERVRERFRRFASSRDIRSSSDALRSERRG